ncbi:MAG: RNase adapter RapZ [Paracoccaceae bacterium]|nr:RNase adapter RapZ [Paracoccaceae bacterium]
MTEVSLTQRKIVFVTGPSGAGRSTALSVLEDVGFDAVDNLPLRLFKPLLVGGNQVRPLALGIDTRNHEFSTNEIIDLLGALEEAPDLTVELLFLDCSTDVLLRRFSETRRRHPLALNGRPSEGIARELTILQPLQKRAHVLIDTSDLNVHQLRDEVERWFAPDGKRSLTISVQSFSYKRGLPRGVDMIFDCRFLQNPHWTPELRGLDGTDAAVRNHVVADPRFASFSEKVLDLHLLLLPAYREEGKSYLSIAFGCTGGQHRSVVTAQTHALRLAEAGWQVSIRHRELDLKKRKEA